MPRLVNYADRFEGIREAVYLITLREGVGGISFDAVGAHLQMSSRTLHRLVYSADALPLLGMQWADKLARRRFIHSHQSRGSRSTADRALDAVLDVLPGHPDREDRRVWWSLVTAFESTTDWAQEARASEDASLASLCEEALADLRAGDLADETRELCCLVLGAVDQILHGHLARDDAAAIIARHVERLRGPGDGGQAAVADPGPTAA